MTCAVDGIENPVHGLLMTPLELTERDATRTALLQRFGGVRIPTLDLYTTGDPVDAPSGTGFVELIDVMGDDARIAAAARLSYSAGKGKKLSEDRALLRYLFRHRHTTPFETAKVTLHLKMPIFVARQLVRHRTASLNEVSGRYSILPDAFYLPPLDQVKAQSVDNKQGRGVDMSPETKWRIRERMRQVATDSFSAYGDFAHLGLAKELARTQLPLSTYTEWWWTFDAHNLFHMLGLRLDPHAQWECRVYAKAIFEIVKVWLPISAEAFVDYRLEAKSLSGPELRVLRAAIESGAPLHRDTLRPALEREGCSAREIGELFETLFSERKDGE